MDELGRRLKKRLYVYDEGKLIKKPFYKLADFDCVVGATIQINSDYYFKVVNSKKIPLTKKEFLDVSKRISIIHDKEYESPKQKLIRSNLFKYKPKKS